jgi:guanylate kinase
MSSDIAARRKGIGHGLAFVVSGPSGAGKNSVINCAMEGIPDLRYSISYTTRLRREHELDGVDYWFVSREEFTRRIESGDFVEHVTYLGDLYGTSKSQIDGVVSQGLDVILNIDVEGAKLVRRTGLGDHTVVFVFLVPSSLARLEERLRARGTESDEQIADRLEAAMREMEAIDIFDYLVINDGLDTAVAELRAIITAERLRIGLRRRQSDERFAALRISE